MFSFFSELVVLTDADSELGKQTTRDLLATGEYHIIGGVSSLSSASSQQTDHFTPIECDLNSFDSVRSFCSEVNEFRLTKPLDRLVCLSAAESDSPQWTKDNFEQIFQQNVLSPFLMTGLLLEGMDGSFDARCTFVSPRSSSDVGASTKLSLQALEDRFSRALNGSDNVDAKKTIADAKLCQKLLKTYLHEKYHKLNQVTFCDISLPSGEGASKCLLDIVKDPKASASSSGESWKPADAGNGTLSIQIDKDEIYKKSIDIDLAHKLFQMAERVTEAPWPKVKVVTSPCPTLKVIGAVTKAQVQKQELKRMRELGRPGISEPEVASTKMGKRQKVAAALDKVATFVFQNTIKRVAKSASSKILGEFPEEAVTNYIETVKDEDIAKLEIEIFRQMLKETSEKKLQTDKSKLIAHNIISECVMDCG